MGNTLSLFENVNERFTEGGMIEKRRILSAIGSNPIPTDGKLSITEHFWLRPVTDELEQVRTYTQQIEKPQKGLRIPNGTPGGNRTPDTRDRSPLL